jgi:hypothetical protein
MKTKWKSETQKANMSCMDISKQMRRVIKIGGRAPEPEEGEDFLSPSPVLLLPPLGSTVRVARFGVPPGSGAVVLVVEDRETGFRTDLSGRYSEGETGGVFRPPRRAIRAARSTLQATSTLSRSLQSLWSGGGSARDDSRGWYPERVRSAAEALSEPKGGDR